MAATKNAKCQYGCVTLQVANARTSTIRLLISKLTMCLPQVMEEEGWPQQQERHFRMPACKAEAHLRVRIHPAMI